ncbi:MAG: acetate--CoA ligase family protein [Alphaproteobacteria bacterium]
MDPRSIAIIGASAKKDSHGNRIISVLREGGFTGRLYAVNPNYDEIDGIPCYPTIGDVPETVELAVLVVANHRVEAQFEALIEAGVPAMSLFSSSYLEDDIDPPLLERLRRLSADAGLMGCGSNCMGFYNFDAKLSVCPFGVGATAGPGPITYITHSGSAFTSLLNLGKRLQFNLAVSAGQEIATTVADYLDYALDLPSTRVAALFLEAIREPEKFRTALAKAQARDIPVVAIKVGRSEASAGFALSHSGAIVGSDDAFQALCDRYGVVRVSSLDDLVATSALLSLPKRAAVGGVASILDSGGERSLLADLADDLHVPFAKINQATTKVLADNLVFGLDPVNPCDAWGTVADFETTFPNCFDALVKDPDTAIGLWLADIRSGNFLADTFIEACRATANSTDKPVIMATWVARQRYSETAEDLMDDVLVIDGVEPALRAIRGALDYRDFRALPAPQPPAPPASDVIDRWRDRLSQGVALGEAEGLSLLADFGVPALAVKTAEDRDGAVAEADAIGYPVVLKTAVDGIHHKSDVGGVKLCLADSDAVGAAYDDLAERLGPQVLIAPMAARGVEMVLGITRDDQFGPLVVVGAGGVLVEVMADARAALPPLDAAGARRLIDQLRVRRLLDGVRGNAPTDIDAVAEAMARLSVLAATLGDCIGELDVNPLIAGPDGCIAVDALVVGRAP